MANAAETQAARPAARPRPHLDREGVFAAINRADRWFSVVGLSFLTPLLKLLAGDSPKAQARELWRLAVVPALAILGFLALWAQTAPMVQTSLGAVPGPAQVWEQAEVLYADHVRKREREAAFYERQEERNAKLAEAGREDRIKWRSYTGAPSYLDQIVTSLQTVFMGFLLAAVVAIPLGVLAGLSPTGQAALNPLIQVFKPVSPLAWLPIVTMVVSAVYVSDDPTFSKSFLNSAITVTLCSLWPALINTALGVASVDKDLLNVAKVLRLSTWTKIRRVILPSALPLIFTGLRLSLGVGWMVLIAAEMLAQNPGLGKFVWDEFQNGSSDSLARIMVAVFTIGLIGFALDRTMYAIQSMVTFSKTR
ncbi:MAG: ABC transporter permease [Paracoccaceae bacterium]